MPEPTDPTGPPTVAHGTVPVNDQCSWSSPHARCGERTPEALGEYTRWDAGVNQRHRRRREATASVRRAESRTPGQRPRPWWRIRLETRSAAGCPRPRDRGDGSPGCGHAARGGAGGTTRPRPAATHAACDIISSDRSRRRGSGRAGARPDRRGERRADASPHASPEPTLRRAGCDHARNAV